MLLKRLLLPFILLSGVPSADAAADAAVATVESACKCCWCWVANRSSNAPFGSIVIETVSSIVKRAALLLLLAIISPRLSRGRLRDILAGVCCCGVAVLDDASVTPDTRCFLAVHVFPKGRVRN